MPASFVTSFMPLVSFYPPKTENVWFSDVFRGYRKISVALNRLNVLHIKFEIYGDF